jgi:hypothetical protein
MRRRGKPCPWHSRQYPHGELQEGYLFRVRPGQIPPDRQTGGTCEAGSNLTLLVVFAEGGTGGVLGLGNLLFKYSFFSYEGLNKMGFKRGGLLLHLYFQFPHQHIERKFSLIAREYLIYSIGFDVVCQIEYSLG